MWTFSKHVQSRMKERNVSTLEILQILNGEVVARVYGCPREEVVDLYFGKVGNKYLMVPVDRETRSIITVRPMKKKEIAAFKEQVENEEEN